MVNIIGVSYFFLQMHIIVNGSKDIFLGDVLGHKFVDAVMDGILSGLLIISISFQNLNQLRVEY